MPRPHAVYVISAGRPANVPAMQALMAPDPLTWVVPWHERHEYKQTGAHRVLPVKDPSPDSGAYALPTARNAATGHAADNNLVCIQTDDDCKSFKHVTDHKATTVPWPQVRDALIGALDGTSHLAGIPPTNNAYFASGNTIDYGFIIGSLCATDTATPSWDNSLPFKEDYDYTCAHLHHYGRVTRLDMYLADYVHYTNRGGAVSNRTAQAEQELVVRLTARWPQYLRPHSRRQGELSFIPRTRKAATR
jgi:hypothetical protein